MVEGLEAKAVVSLALEKGAPAGVGLEAMAAGLAAVAEASVGLGLEAKAAATSGKAAGGWGPLPRLSPL
jgi:hypothetical protein